MWAFLYDTGAPAAAAKGASGAVSIAFKNLLFINAILCCVFIKIQKTLNIGFYGFTTIFTSLPLT